MATKKKQSMKPKLTKDQIEELALGIGLYLDRCAWNVFEEVDDVTICTNCGENGAINYCPHCGTCRKHVITDYKGETLDQLIEAVKTGLGRL